MREGFVTATILVLAACSFLLDDPAPFEPDLPDVLPDAEVLDARPDMQIRLPEAFIPRDATHDAAPVRNDAAPDAVTLDGGADACVPAEEVCNQRDDNCDGRVDESYPGRCEACGPPGAQGVCGRGRMICVFGRLECVSWLPAPGPSVPCDLLDNDCDGEIDEGIEVVPEWRNEPETQATRFCGLPSQPTGFPGREDECCVEPRVVGCYPVHACVDRACYTICIDQRQDQLGECDGANADDPRGLGVCRDGADGDFLACLGGCNSAGMFTCSGGESGPICSLVDVDFVCRE